MTPMSAPRVKGLAIVLATLSCAVDFVAYGRSFTLALVTTNAALVCRHVLKIGRRPGI